MTYQEWKSKEQKAADELPIFWAFSNKQFEEALKERNATASDVYRLPIATGGFYLKKDADIIHKWFERPDDLQDLMKDATFALEAFIYEMHNHEYGINYQGDWDVCSCFGYCEYGADKDGADYLREIGYGDDVIAQYRLAISQYYKESEQ